MVPASSRGRPEYLVMGPATSRPGRRLKVGMDFVRTTASWHAERRIVLVVVAGILMGFLSVLFLRTEPSAATVTPGFEDR